MPLDSIFSATLLAAEGFFVRTDFTRDADLERHGFSQPDFRSNGPRSEAESRKTGLPSRKRLACVSQRVRRSAGLA
jgi:hypothetical protein